VVGSYEGMSGNSIIDSENPLEPWGPVLTGWNSIGNGTRIMLDKGHALSEALPVSMELDIPPTNQSFEVGFLNYGMFFGTIAPMITANLPRMVGNRRLQAKVQRLLLRAAQHCARGQGLRRDALAALQPDG
jgi:hypothetical protein